MAPTEPDAGTTAEVTRDTLLRASYTETTKWLRSKHQDEFNRQRQAWLRENGVDWTPPLSEDQKAEAELASLLAKHPELADKVVEMVAPKR